MFHVDGDALVFIAFSLHKWFVFQMFSINRQWKNNKILIWIQEWWTIWSGPWSNFILWWSIHFESRCILYWNDARWSLFPSGNFVSLLWSRWLRGTSRRKKKHSRTLTSGEKWCIDRHAFQNNHPEWYRAYLDLSTTANDSLRLFQFHLIVQCHMQ